MSFIFRWKPSVMPLLLEKRHMQTMASSQLARDQARGTLRELIANIDDSITHCAIETANLKDRGRLPVEVLPDVAAGLNVGTVNLGNPVLMTGVQVDLRTFEKGGRGIERG